MLPGICSEQSTPFFIAFKYSVWVTLLPEDHKNLMLSCDHTLQMWLHKWNVVCGHVEQACWLQNSLLGKLKRASSYPEEMRSGKNVLTKTTDRSVV
jgi:hypothetical protein